ncbi:Sugar kinase of the NBD/HSP70 family, may contain an N-terminal HTH domain [Nakamurella panacisegetis]|uniref:Sugar kinase of the NBD/HSP70 family, may contain an N-terminal HTH domain n=1 Tax=Nakamurella panacisegetis TaxID=1090615 RepID=A0A1H0M6X2_9ACTN|nr:ROK family transcriptional regulator [Nakamurella panacisegetis]SDO76095.1 Sugar kinase of the NBD/HSP70 family, may contain an N-terminal HTH domain [Nakamurella panacisegetis]
MRTLSATGAVGSPADQATVRRLNLGLLMRSLAAGGPRSRARLAEDTGLNKATVSSLVTELVDRGLVTEGIIQRRGVGRPGRTIEVNVGVVRCIGLELNVDYLAGVITDLTGRVLARRRMSLPMLDLGPARAMGQVAEMAGELVAGCGATPNQVQTLHLSLPGLIDIDAGVLAYGPNLRWRQVDVVHTLMGRLRWAGTRIAVDNDANLGAMAEYASGPSAGSNNLLYLVGEIGVGAGMIIDGRIVRGATGFAGEVGHMPIGDPTVQCGCGRRGCWETAVGMNAVVDAVSADRGDRLREGDMTARLAEIVRRAEAGDARTLAALTSAGRNLGVGASVLANLLDPEVIIFGGHFAALEKYVADAVSAEMRSRVLGGEVMACRIEYSTLGFEAPALGAAHAGIDSLINDPTLVLVAQ